MSSGQYLFFLHKGRAAGISLSIKAKLRFLKRTGVFYFLRGKRCRSLLFLRGGSSPLFLRGGSSSLFLRGGSSLLFLRGGNSSLFLRGGIRISVMIKQVALIDGLGINGSLGNCPKN